MKYILLDTNILIYREGEQRLSCEIESFFALLADSEEYRVKIHPLSIQELEGHKNQTQRDTMLSKIKAYKQLSEPPIPTGEFLKRVGGADSGNDGIDNQLLYAIQQSCCDLMVTNDKGLLKKAQKIGLGDKVYSVEIAIEFLESLLKKEKETDVKKTFAELQEKYLYHLELKDAIFDGLRKNYWEFDEWYKRKSGQEKKAFVTYKGDTNELGSFLLLQIEEPKDLVDNCAQPLPQEKSLKISTLIVTDHQKAFGELFVKTIFECAVKNDLRQIYCTVFENDETKTLVKLLVEYGFEKYTTKTTLRGDRGEGEESVYLHTICKEHTRYPMVKTSDGNAWVVPIDTRYHERLFPEYCNPHNRQITMAQYEYQGKAIKKAYLCNANTKSIEPGDVLFFYHSRNVDQHSCQAKKAKSITTVGVVDKVFRAQSVGSVDVLQKWVVRRTVYEKDEIEKYYQKNGLVILFKHFVTLEGVGVKMPDIGQSIPQSIMGLKKEQVEQIVALANTKQLVE
ncbi:MAG: hypothetical protein FWD76_01260 [Firmicutes bacterium]|nr:hypothetical protein [Bacillota bacterium]